MTKLHTFGKQAIVIYHANCDDGFGAALAFWKYQARHYTKVEYFPASYGKSTLPAIIDKETDIYILDFSFSPEQLLELGSICHSLRLYDHHKTAADAWHVYWMENLSDAIPSNMIVEFDMNHSGAMLALQHFANDDKYCIMFDFLQDRDLWRFHLPDTKFFTQYLRSMPQDFKRWDEVAERLNSPESYSAIMNGGEAILERFDQMCSEIVGTCKKEVWVNGIKGLQCNCNGIFASDVGNILAKESGTFGLTWYNNRDGRLVFSIRSIGDFDVSALAKSFGGGGHKNASGFTISQLSENDTEEKMDKYYEMLNRITNEDPEPFKEE